MKAVVPLMLCLLGVATATAVGPRDDPPEDDYTKEESYDKEPEDKAYPDKGYPEKGYQEKGYPDKGYPDKGYPDKGYPDKGYPDKGYPDKGYPDGGDKGYPDGDDGHTPWKPLTKDPHFFNIKVDDYCSYETFDAPQGVDASTGAQPPKKRQLDDPTLAPDYRYCPLQDYAIRLEKGSVIATPYNKWYDSDLPTFFVDDDTQLYTVSKEPLQIYVDAVTGAVQYTKVGWLPPNAISTGFYHTGDNPIGVLHPSSAYLTWPSTFNTPAGGNFLLCPLGQTKQYKVYVDFANFYPQGVVIDSFYCSLEHLAAVNANPWKKGYEGSDGWKRSGAPHGHKA